MQCIVLTLTCLEDVYVCRSMAIMYMSVAQTVPSSVRGDSDSDSDSPVVGGWYRIRGGKFALRTAARTVEMRNCNRGAGDGQRLARCHGHDGQDGHDGFRTGDLYHTGSAFNNSGCRSHAAVLRW